MFAEFKKFAMKGNVMDMAVGVIVGGAFGKIVASLVADIIMPIVGLLLGGVSFDNLFIALDGKQYESLAVAEEAGAAVLKYGNFLQVTVDFLIIAFSIFLVVKAINSMKKPVEVEVTTKECPHCLNTVPLKATKCGFCTSDLEV